MMKKIIAAYLLFCASTVFSADRRLTFYAPGSRRRSSGKGRASLRVSAHRPNPLRGRGTSSSVSSLIPSQVDEEGLQVLTPEYAAERKRLSDSAHQLVEQINKRTLGELRGLQLWHDQRMATFPAQRIGGMSEVYGVIALLGHLRAGVTYAREHLDRLFIEMYRIQDLIKHDYEEIGKLFSRLNRAIKNGESSSIEKRQGYIDQAQEAKAYLPQLFQELDENMQLLERTEREVKEAIKKAKADAERAHKQKRERQKERQRLKKEALKQEREQCRERAAAQRAKEKSRHDKASEKFWRMRRGEDDVSDAESEESETFDEGSELKYESSSSDEEEASQGRGPSLQDEEMIMEVMKQSVDDYANGRMSQRKQQFALKHFHYFMKAFRSSGKFSERIRLLMRETSVGEIGGRILKACPGMVAQIRNAQQLSYDVTPAPVGGASSGLSILLPFEADAKLREVREIFEKYEGDRSFWEKSNLKEFGELNPSLYADLKIKTIPKRMENTCNKIRSILEKKAEDRTSKEKASWSKFKSDNKKMAQALEELVESEKRAAEASRELAEFREKLQKKQKKRDARERAKERKQWRQRRDINKVEEFVVEQEASIDQVEYEKNDKHNILEGRLLCGVFAAYNGELMLDQAHGRRGRFNSRFRLDGDIFNRWMLECNGHVVHPLQRHFGDLTGATIEQLLPHTDDNFYQDNSTVIELATLQQSFINMRGGRRLFVPVGDHILNAIRAFRQTNSPHLVILNTGAHWIAMVISPGRCVVADSLNIDRKNDAAVEVVYHLFTQQQLPAPDRIAQLRALHRDHHRGDEVAGTLREHASSKVTKATKGKGRVRKKTKKRSQVTKSASDDERGDTMRLHKAQRVAETPFSTKKRVLRRSSRLHAQQHKQREPSGNGSGPVQSDTKDDDADGDDDVDMGLPACTVTFDPADDLTIFDSFSSEVPRAWAFNRSVERLRDTRDSLAQYHKTVPSAGMLGEMLDLTVTSAVEMYRAENYAGAAAAGSVGQSLGVLGQRTVHCVRALAHGMRSGAIRASDEAPGVVRGAMYDPVAYVVDSVTGLTDCCARVCSRFLKFQYLVETQPRAAAAKLTELSKRLVHGARRLARMYTAEQLCEAAGNVIGHSVVSSATHGMLSGPFGEALNVLRQTAQNLPLIVNTNTVKKLIKKHGKPSVEKAVEEVGRNHKLLEGADAARVVEKAALTCKEVQYKEITKKTSRYPNAQTSITRSEFERNLQRDGWIKSTSKDGKVHIYKKDGARYVLRNNARSTGAPTADFYKKGSIPISVKIRLIKG